ncbi:MAG: GTP-binding protein, partial [Psychrosphaera sp.]|nr:GTP-binding protein [Psychrosphaera sp.]
MYSFLDGFEKISVAEIKDEQSYWQVAANKIVNRFCVNDAGELTHLLVRGDTALSFLTELESIDSLVELTLQKCELTEVPAVIGQMIQLVVIDLDSNKITQLPSSIGQLTALQHLSLNGNAFTQFDETFCALKHLVQLELGRNQLTVLSAGIEALSQLQQLDLRFNKLITLPAEVGKLSQLTTLRLNGNRLTTLPAEISKLSQLTTLRLTNNQLTRLPVEIGKLSQLEVLFLNGNELTELPENLSKMDRLAFFNISNNPITKNIHEIANDLPAKELIAYLLEIQKQETQTLNEAKVLVVGDERVGKTSIINRIIGREMDEEEKSTMGIDIQRHPLGNGVNINIWDFAGQQITQHTHQFFLSSRSLYLYILDAQKEDNDSDITQWLNTISATAGDSPIIVVVNKCDLNPGYRFDFHRYQQDFNIVKVLYTTAQDEAKIKAEVLLQISDSIDCLVTVVTEQIGQIKEVKMPFPPSWLAVKKELEDEQRKETDFIESAAYEYICKSHGLTNETLQDALLSVLNQIGTIVTYKDHQRLSVMQIINPAWVTNGVYKILRSNEINKSNATLNQQQFKRIFANEPKYRQSRHYTWLIDLLKQFRLAFSIDDHTVLIPSRLESAQPAIDMADYQQGLHFVFEYDGILKKNILHQFIVLMHEYITTDEDKYWQRG